jgi:DNA-binding LytR/AlgR family response regulator
LENYQYPENMEKYRAAGLGGMEITAIYGVRGQEDKSTEYLSPEWMNMFTHTLREAERLDLGIDLANASGWPFGGPWIDSADACKNIIFTTAYSEFALNGYEHNTIDYLLKPFSFERFLKAVNKAADIASASGKGTLNRRYEKNGSISNYLTIRADRKLYKINYNDILFIEGQKAYVTFHTTERNITAIAAMKELENSLPPSMFARIHKSFIVAVRLIESLEGNLIGISGKKLPVGRNYREKVEAIFRIRK